MIGDKWSQYYLDLIFWCNWVCKSFSSVLHVWFLRLILLFLILRFSIPVTSTDIIKSFFSFLLLITWQWFLISLAISDVSFSPNTVLSAYVNPVNLGSLNVQFKIWKYIFLLLVIVGLEQTTRHAWKRRVHAEKWLLIPGFVVKAVKR